MVAFFPIQCRTRPTGYDGTRQEIPGTATDTQPAIVTLLPRPMLRLFAAVSAILCLG